MGGRDRGGRFVLHRRHRRDRAQVHRQGAAGPVRGLRQAAQRRARATHRRLGVLARRGRALHGSGGRRDPAPHRAARRGGRLPRAAPQLLLRPLDRALRVVSGLPAAAALSPRQADVHRRRGPRNLRAGRRAGQDHRADRASAVQGPRADRPQDAALLDARRRAPGRAPDEAVDVVRLRARPRRLPAPLRRARRFPRRLGRLHHRLLELRGHVLPLRQARGAHERTRRASRRCRRASGADADFRRRHDVQPARRPARRAGRPWRASRPRTSK